MQVDVKVSVVHDQRGNDGMRLETKINSLIKHYLSKAYSYKTVEIQYKVATDGMGTVRESALLIFR